MPTCCWSPFGPGVLDRLGVGYERLREVNPRLVYCAITGYGQDGPNRDRSGHDMNYLGLNGLLGLTGEADGPPVQAAGQIADIGGGALMGASGSWSRCASASAPARASSSTARCSTARCRGWRWWRPRRSRAVRHPGAGSCRWPGRLTCYRPYRCADGYVTLGALEPKFWQAWCAGSAARTCSSTPSIPPGSEAHRAVCEIFAERTREQWRQFASEHDCCLEPVLELDEALASELVAAREMVVELEQPGAEQPVRLLGAADQAEPHARATRPARPGPALGEHTDEVLAAAGFAPEEIAALLRRRRRRPVRRRGRRRARS